MGRSRPLKLQMLVVLSRPPPISRRPSARSCSQKPALCPRSPSIYRQITVFSMAITLDSPDLYTVGWIAALPIERAAATAMLDERHDPPADFEQNRADSNAYTWGRIYKHNVVIASLPAGIYGTSAAATTASNLLSSLPDIRIGLLVGIGSGIPRLIPGTEQVDIRLGDIAVSQPTGTEGGVIQYDLGKSGKNDAWERKGSLDKPPQVLLSALSHLQAERELSPSKVPGILQDMRTKYPLMTNKPPGYIHQGLSNDRLFAPTYDHNSAGGDDCSQCDACSEVVRAERHSSDPEIHYGTIASSNLLVKDAKTRDNIAARAGQECICVEMGAAGLMDRFPCLVIRGICDYCDSHRNDRWQKYASATAAAFAKELLSFVPARKVKSTPRAVDEVRSSQ